MKTLTRPSQAELDAMGRAEKDALILKLFDWLEQLEARLEELENRWLKTVVIQASRRHRMS